MEYVPFGDLDRLLRPYAADGSFIPLTEERLSWAMRYRIALDVAKAMRYSDDSFIHSLTLAHYQNTS